MSKFVNALLEDLKKTSKYLKEDYIFNDEEGPMGPEDMEGGMPGEGPMRQPDPTQPEQQPQAAQQGDNVEAQAMHAQGLKKYSDNPTSKLYEFFKKVFLESDKVLTDTGSKN